MPAKARRKVVSMVETREFRVLCKDGRLERLAGIGARGSVNQRGDLSVTWLDREGRQYAQSFAWGVWHAFSWGRL